MRVSDAVKADPDFRQKHKAKTLLASIETRYQYYLKHHADELLPIHTARKQHVEQVIQQEIEQPTSQHQMPLSQLPAATVMDHIYQYLPKPRPKQLDPVEQSMVELMTMRGRELAKQAQQFQLAGEIAYRAHQGWFMIFNTLTVAPEHYYDVFSKGSLAFADYIRRLDRMVAASAYGTVRAAKGQDYHTHFACVEEGGRHGRLHIHCVHFMQTLPRGSEDPNKGAVRPGERQLRSIVGIWPYGRDDPLMVRYSPQDAFGKKGYRWPLDRKTQAPMLIKSPLALASYMSKYLKKAHLSCRRQKLLWRVRKSHKLGLQIMDELAEQLSTSTLAIITAADILKSRFNNQLIPQSQLRLAALRALQNRPSTKSPNGSTVSLSALTALSTPRLSPLHSLRASTQQIHENSLSSTQYLSTLGYQSEDISNAWWELQRATRALNYKYFPEPRARYGTTSSRDHIYGS